MNTIRHLMRALITAGCASFLVATPVQAQTTNKASSAKDPSLIVHCQNYQLKPRLKDKGSYKRTGKLVERESGEINVYIRYTAKNSFGGRIEGMAKCVYDFSGSIKRFENLK